MVLITSPASDAEVELDGVFVGSVPATLYVPAGRHELVVKKGTNVWLRRLQVSAGSTISIYATPVARREPSAAAGV